MSISVQLQERNVFASNRDELIYNKLLFDREDSSHFKKLLPSPRRAGPTGMLPPILVSLLFRTRFLNDPSFFFHDLARQRTVSVKTVSYGRNLSTMTWEIRSTPCRRTKMKGKKNKERNTMNTRREFRFSSDSFSFLVEFEDANRTRDDRRCVNHFVGKLRFLGKRVSLKFESLVQLKCRISGSASLDREPFLEADSVFRLHPPRGRSMRQNFIFPLLSFNAIARIVAAFVKTVPFDTRGSMFN